MKIGDILVYSLLGGGLVASVSYNIMMNRLLDKIDPERKAAVEAAVLPPEKASEKAPEKASAPVAAAAATPATPATPESTIRGQNNPKIPPAPVPREFLAEQSSGCNVNEFKIQYPEPVKSDSDVELAKKIEITPAVKFTVRTTSDYWCGSGIVISSAEFTPGKVYKVTVKPGIAPNNPHDRYGRVRYYPSTVEQTFAFLAPDRRPELSFVAKANIYPLNAPIRELPVRAVNAGETATVTVYELYANQRYCLGTGDEITRSVIASGKQILEKKFPLRLGKNQQATLGLEFEKFGLAKKPGVFVLEITGENTGWNDDRALLVVTDLVLQTVSDAAGNHFILQSISTGRPVAGAKITLLSSKNQTVASGMTDADGMLFLDAASCRTDDKNDSVVLIQAEKDGDLTFLKYGRAYKRPASDLPDEDKPGDGDIAYAWPERDICRPGDNIALFAMLRGGAKRLARAGVPVDIVVSADSSPFEKRISGVTDEAGCVRADFAVPWDSPLCSYTVSVLPRGAENNAAFSRTSFSVNEFIPDDLKAEITGKIEKDQLSATGKVSYYFGTPLQGQNVTGGVYYTTGTYHSKRYGKYAFCTGLPNDSEHKNKTLRTDKNGAFSFTLDLTAPREDLQGRPFVYRATVDAAAPGSRSVSCRSGEMVRHFAPFYVGLKDDSETKSGKTFAIAVVDSEDRDVAAPKLRYALTRNEWDYVLTAEGFYRWQEKTVEHCAPTPLEIKDGKFTLPLDRWGQYTMSITDEKGRLFNQCEFWFSAGESGRRSSNPCSLVFQLDREKAQPGDTVTVSFDSAIEGAGIVVAGASKVENFTRFDVKKGKNAVKIAVPADSVRGGWHAGFTIVGKYDGKDLNRVRLFGVATIPVDQSAHRMEVKIEAPEKAYPEETVSMKVSLKNAAGAPASGRVQLWGVDRGILSLTGFKTPDPYQYFFRTYGCPFTFDDAFGEIYELLELDRKAIGGGEDGAAAREDFQSERKEERKKAAVFVLDTVAVPASGEAVVSVRMPKHTGGLRLMAVAASADKIGSVEREMILRNDLTVKILAPRVLAPNDECTISFSAFNHELADGQAVWTVDGFSGASAVGEKTGSFELKKGASAAGSFRVKADANPEKVKFRVNLTLGGRTVSEDVAVTVRAALPERSVYTVETLSAGRKTFTAGKKQYIEIGSPVLAISGALDFLNEYPYGCLEQTTSAAFPFLAVKPLTDAGLLDPAFAADAKTKIESAVRRIGGMHYSGISFRMWPEEVSYNTWPEGSYYAAHFLLEAGAAGYSVPQSLRYGITQALAEICSNNGTAAGVRAYCTYIYSLVDPERAAAYAELQLTDKKLKDYSKFLLAATLVRGGNAALGMPLLKEIIKRDFYLENDGGLDLIDSIPRRLGLALWILADIMPDSPENIRFADAVRRQMLPGGHWGTTQNNAWCALGLSRWFAKQHAVTPDASVTVNGKTEKFTGFHRIAAGRSAEVEVRSGNLFVFDRKRAVPEVFTPESNGFAVSKVYLNEKGLPVTKAKLGDLLTVIIKIQSDKFVENAVLSDLLPGGLEIEDETLLTRRSTPGQSQEDARKFYIKLKERRFDRFLLFGNTGVTTDNDPAVVTYRVRAAVRGKFVLPPVQIEAMYEPELRASSRPADVFEVE